ncbi:competence type IV pilus minor pilin ComGF [Bacillus gobiensis]|uniref:competence type IV pilus minor pilin ComGF n=1 Tax=Bacillus gobiensis TaxID=1441095 RepID=UPI003D1A4630
MNRLALGGKADLKKTSIAYPFTKQNGYTLLNVLLSLSLFIFMSGSFGTLLHYLMTKEGNEAIYQHEWTNTVEQMLLEIKQGGNVRVINAGRGIEFENQQGQTIRYEKYQQVLRKRVDLKGHVLVLQHVADVAFSLADGQVSMKVISSNQSVYEASFPIYQYFGGDKP